MNETLLLWINQSWATPTFDIFFIWLSEKNTFSIPLLAIIIINLGVRYGKSGWALGIMMIIIAGTGDIIGNFLKSWFLHARPCLDFHDQIRMPRTDSIFCAKSQSGMPSNHALNFFATFSFLCFFVRHHIIITLSVVLCVLVAISRVYLGEHFPAQVAVGAIIGTGYGLLLATIVSKQTFSDIFKHLPYYQKHQFNKEQNSWNE